MFSSTGSSPRDFKCALQDHFFCNNMNPYIKQFSKTEYKGVSPSI